MIAVVLRATLASPETMMQFQLLIDQPANRASFGGGKPSVYLLGESSTPFAFVAKLPAKLAPAAIKDAFSQVVVLDHPGYIQIFNLDVPKLGSDPVAEFMQEILPLMGNLLVQQGHPLPRLLSPLAALFATAQNPLRSFQLALGLAKILRVFNLLAGRENGKMFDAQVALLRVAQLRLVSR